MLLFSFKLTIVYVTPFSSEVFCKELQISISVKVTYYFLKNATNDEDGIAMQNKHRPVT